MNSKIKFFTAISIIAIALTACSGLSAETQNIDTVSAAAGAAEQALPDGQPPQGQMDGQQGEHPQIDLASAASTLGVTEEALMAALGEPGQGPPDLASAAAELGVTEEALITALGVPVGGPDGQGGQGQPSDGQAPQIDLASAASTLGITEEALKAALGAPPPDFAAAAAKLGITEQALTDALGIPAGGPPNNGG